MNINHNLPHNLPRLLPENLYHITTAKRFAKIKEDKFLKAMPDTLTGGKVKGVFTFDLNNFINQWTKDKHMNLARLILDYIAKEKELVVLRIPLKKLPEEQIKNIKTRDVKKTIDWKFESGYYNQTPKEVLGINIADTSKEAMDNRAIEHILPEDIPVENIECLGIMEYVRKLNLGEILTGFFKKQPEEKIIKDNMDMLI